MKIIINIRKELMPPKKGGRGEYDIRGIYFQS
jgi:hypothetical protein